MVGPAPKREAVKEEVARLESEAERLAREIGELTGNDFSVL